MVYDLIIIGGSAAATSAGIYAARRGLNFKIISRDFGGEVATSGEIGNWPGIPKTDGLELSEMFKKHLQSLDVSIEEGVWVEKITKQENGNFCITAKTGKEEKMAAENLPNGGNSAPKCDYEARAVIVTTGVHPRELNVEGEKEYRNRGVSYCTTCDGPLFAGKVTATIGGGNSALESALMMADVASKVYVINKNSEFNGDQLLINNLKAKPNVEIVYNADTNKIFGDEFVKGLQYKSADVNIHDLTVDGIFVHIGMIPNSDLVPVEVEKNEVGEIKVNANCETSIPGLYAAGDVTNVPFKQIVIAAGRGTIALLSAVNYLNKLQK